jgi:hypothetical protein
MMIIIPCRLKLIVHRRKLHFSVLLLSRGVKNYNFGPEREAAFFTTVVCGGKLKLSTLMQSADSSYYIFFLNA